MGMKIDTMRRVDAWLGWPGCAVLTLGRKLRDLFPRRAPGPIEKIGVLKLAEQGSTVLAYGALQRATDRVGRENVYFLVFEENRAILDAMEVIPAENVIAIRTSGLFRTLFSTLGAVRRMRKLGIDATVDLEFFARSTAILGFLTKANRRVGLHAYGGDGPRRGDLMTHRVQYNSHHHTSQLFDLLIQALEEPTTRFPTFPPVPTPVEELPHGTFEPSDDERETVRGIVRDALGEDAPGPVVLLNANCSDLLPLRRWADANYIALAERLLRDDPSIRIAFTGAPAEAAPVEDLVALIGDPRVVSVAGKTTMRELLVLYGLADVMVTNDSGPAHFASLTPIDVVTLFGPETPALFGVVGPRSHVLWARTACSPCVNAYNNRVLSCRDNVCMRSIDVDEVHATVTRVLTARRFREGRA